MRRQRWNRYSERERAAATALRPARPSPPLGSRSLDLLTGLILLLLLSLPLAARSEPTAAPASPLPNVSAPPPSLRVVSLDSLTLLPSPRDAEALAPSHAAAADRAIADAAEAGSDPSLELPSPFRKRDFDLIRGRRELEIAGREMELRWRVRPKTKETISLELRF